MRNIDKITKSVLRIGKEVTVLRESPTTLLLAPIYITGALFITIITTKIPLVGLFIQIHGSPP